VTPSPTLLQESVLAPVVYLSATNGTGLTYNVSAPLVLEATLLPVSGIAISAAPVWTSSDIGAVGAAGV